MIDNDKMWLSLLLYNNGNTELGADLRQALNNQGLRYNPETNEIERIEPEFKIEAGKWYLCVKDFYGIGVRFYKGNAYYCGHDGCLQEFDSGAHIPIVEELYEYFRPWAIQDAKERITKK